MSIGRNNSIEMFAQRMERRAKVMQLKVDALMRERFESIANTIFLYNPVWSSQSVVNWTASIGHLPLRRLVNVDKANDPNTEGSIKTITPHNKIAGAAAREALSSALGVSSKYRRTKNTRYESKSIWLTNNVSYTGDLWSGAWPTNRFKGDLSQVVAKAAKNSTQIKVWRF